MKHTSGPWDHGKRIDVGKRRYDIRSSNGRLIATVEGFNVRYGELEANARLIAASPDVAVALRNLTETVEAAIDAGLFLSVDGKRPDVMALLDAKAALAKVDG